MRNILFGIILTILGGNVVFASSNNQIEVNNEQIEIQEITTEKINKKIKIPENKTSEKQLKKVI